MTTKKYFSPEHRRNIGKAKKGQIPWNKGKKLKPLSAEHKRKIGIAMTGKKLSEETKLKLRLAQLGEKSHAWRGGSSFEPYPTTWTNDLREAIRKRDNWLCQECFKSQEEDSRKLAVHHIDYNKKNLDPNNLICLCLKCHIITNHNRAYWESHFNEKIMEMGLKVFILC